MAEINKILGNIQIWHCGASDEGVITRDGSPWMHDFSHPTGDTQIPAGRNIFMGQGAGNFTMGSTATSTDHASYNIGIGASTLTANTTGNYNIAVGTSALLSNTVGVYNVAVGRSAMQANQSGSDNIALGRNAFTQSSSGSYNIALGFYTLASGNPVGNYNIGIGYDALRYTTGNNNIGIGAGTLISNTTGTNNIAIGNGAGNSSIGTLNIYLGTHAGYYETGSNKLYISSLTSTQQGGNEATAKTKVIIYGEQSETTANQKIWLNALIKTSISTYDALVVDDNDIPNKKYIDLNTMANYVTTTNQDWDTWSPGRAEFLTSNVNGPLGSTNVHGIFLPHGSGSTNTYGTVIAGRLNTDPDPDEPTLWFRNLEAGTWTDWQEIIHSGNISTYTASNDFPDGIDIDSDQSYGTASGIRFGDGDMNIYESADDTLVIGHDSNLKLFLSANQLRVSDLASGGTYSLVTDAYVATYANNTFFGYYAGRHGVTSQNTGAMFFCKHTTTNTGPAFNFMTDLVTDALIDTDAQQSFVQIDAVVAQSGTAAYDALKIDVTETSLGDGSTGDGNNLLNVSLSGSSRFKITNTGDLWLASYSGITLSESGPNIFNINGYWDVSSNYIKPTDNLGGAILNETPSATNPVVIPAYNDLDTGLGLAAVDELSLISGGIEAVRYEEASSHVIQKVEIDVGITASTTQVQGQQVLLSSYNEVSTVSNANDVVTMPSAEAGRKVTIINNGANSLQVYPSSGDDVGLGVDTSYTLSSGSTVTFLAYNTTNWVSI